MSRSGGEKDLLKTSKGRDHQNLVGEKWVRGWFQEGTNERH